MNYSEKQIRQNKITMRECIEALGTYAAMVANANHNSIKAEGIRDLIAELVPYWGLDIGDDSKSVENYLQAFDDKVDDAVRKGWIEDDEFTACYNVLTGLAQYGEDLVGAQGSDAMAEILKIGDLLNETGEFFGYHQEKVFADNSARWLRNSVKGMLNDYALPGNAIEGSINANYTIKQAVLYDNNVGFAFAHNTEAASPFVTWRMFNDNGKLNYEWGNYFDSEEKALVNYITRAKEYALNERVSEIQMPMVEIPQLKQLIQFIDSEYREQFQIPDGESIRVTYPPSDGRPPAEGVCKYMGSTHADIKGNCYHIHQWATTMERLGATFEPVNQLQEAKIEPYAGIIGEDKFYNHNREDGNTCVGSLHGNFGNDGERYSASWNEKDNGLYTAEIQSELQSVVYALRKDLLKDRASMLAYCENNPEAKLSEGKGFNDMDYATYGFKLETEKRQYFINCFSQGKDSRFSIFAYADKPALMLEQKQQSAEQDNLRVYHADFTDPEIDERMEIIRARDDADALRQANIICEEAEGIALVELNEIDEDFNSREVEIPRNAVVQETRNNATLPSVRKEAETQAVSDNKSSPSKETKPKKQYRGEDR